MALTKKEREAAAKAAESYPVGRAYHWFADEDPDLDLTDDAEERLRTKGAAFG